MYEFVIICLNPIILDILTKIKHRKDPYRISGGYPRKYQDIIACQLSISQGRSIRDLTIRMKSLVTAC